MIDKLFKSSLLKIIVRTIRYMLNNTFPDVVKYIFTIARSNSEKGEWKLNTGSRQGGILPPLPFNFYINGCVQDIVNHDIGCTIVLIKWNVIAHANDIVLMAPSLKRFAKVN